MYAKDYDAYDEGTDDNDDEGDADDVDAGEGIAVDVT